MVVHLERCCGCAAPHYREQIDGVVDATRVSNEGNLFEGVEVVELFVGW